MNGALQILSQKQSMLISGEGDYDIEKIIADGVQRAKDL